MIKQSVVYCHVCLWTRDIGTLVVTIQWRLLPKDGQEWQQGQL